MEKWDKLNKFINELFQIPDIKSDISKVKELFNELKKDEESISKLMLTKLYDNGLNFLKKSEIKDICPLCDQKFDGKLYNYIDEKNSKLTDINEKKGKLKKILEPLIKNIENISVKLRDISNIDIKNIDLTKTLKKFIDLIEFKSQLKEITNSLDSTIKNLDGYIIDSKIFFKKNTELINFINRLFNLEIKIKEELKSKIKKYDKDNHRKLLLNNYENIKGIYDYLKEYSVLKKKHKKIEHIIKAFNKVFCKYKDWLKSQIELKFKLISDEVVTYFKILEKDNEYIQNPKISFSQDINKAVELEIDFVNKTISPVYKILSESQLNSFGLSIFLAAIKNFNKDFKFIILDDVINSFDSYKRYCLIELLNEHFNDYQLLILTHDQIWFDQLRRIFNNSIFLRFYGWDYNNGPKIEISNFIIKEIENLIKKDKPIDAGQKLGRYLEWILQVLNEKFQAPIKFKINNQYTLSELFDPFISRVKNKIKTNSQLYILLKNFQDKTIFRNFCVHYKNPETEYSSNEIKQILNEWVEIEDILFCEKCKSYVYYDQNKKPITCKCGEKILSN